LCLSHPANPRGALIDQSNHTRVKFITKKDILFFFPLIIEELEGSPVRWVAGVQWVPHSGADDFSPCRRRRKRNYFPSVVKPARLVAPQLEERSFLQLTRGLGAPRVNLPT
jgi:hypothetical protein